MVETDIANCFEAIPRSSLIHVIEEQVSDRKLLAFVDEVQADQVADLAGSQVGSEGEVQLVEGLVVR